MEEAFDLLTKFVESFMEGIGNIIKEAVTELADLTADTDGIFTESESMVVMSNDKY